MKKLLSLVLAIAIMICVVPLGAFTFTASAENATSGTTGDCTWSLDGTVLTISGNGEMGYDGCVEWGSDITKVIIENGVTSIGQCAFYSCISLESIIIPNSVTSIGSSAFFYCLSLANVTIPDSVISIGSGAFYHCTSLTSITIPDGVTSIGSSTFESCSNLTNIQVSANNGNYSSIDGVLFNKDKTTLICYPASKTNTSYTIPDGVASIGRSAFDGCTGLTSVNISKGVTSIGNGAFYGCTNLTRVNIPVGVTSIENYAFQKCASLESITIPNSVTSIGVSTFYGCSSFKSITIPNSVTSIGLWAFSGCSSLVNIQVLANNVNYSSIDGVLFNKDKTTLICYPASKTNSNYTIPDSVTSIVDDAFRGCESLTSVTIPDTVISISLWAFDGCNNLENVYYKGSEADKENILIDNYNLPLIDATWYYNSCIGSNLHTYDNYCDKSCNICGATRTITHNYDSGKITTKPTCTRTGVKTYTCTECGKNKTESIAKVTHTYASATCTKAKTCKVCGVTSGKALGHTYTTTTAKATLAKNGKAVKKCKVCSKIASTTTIKYVKSFKLTTTSYTYNGKVKIPSVTVKDSAGKTLKKNTDYTVSYASGRKNVGTYKVTVKMKGKYSGTKTFTFKINPVKTTLSKLTTGKKSFTVNIAKKSTQVSGYQVQYSTSKSFSKTTTKTISSYKTTKYTLKSLSAKKTYYVRVRTYKTVSGVKYYSGWSTYKYVKTK